MKARAHTLVSFGTFVGACGEFFVGHRAMPPMSNADQWQRALAAHVGAREAAQLVKRAELRYEKLYASRPHFAPRALHTHLTQNILPALALYQALRERFSREVVEPLMAELLPLSAGFAAQRARLAWLRRVPNPFGLLRWGLRWTLRREYPREGWDVEWVENSAGCVAFDVHRCFYLRMLAYYSATELTRLFCQLDARLFASLPPSIAGERSKALGCGDGCCNFRWFNTAPN